ncbi:MAG: TIGR03013 family XrtA/PEP-CTERM system glycosyltransferase [Pseudomonadota bacterium]
MAIRIFDHYVHAPVVLLVLVEAVVVVLMLGLGHEIAHATVLPVPSTGGEGWGLWACAIAASVLLMAMASTGLYRIALRARFAGVLARLLVAFIVSAVFLPFLYYVAPPLYIHPVVMAVSSVFALAALSATRVAFLKLVDENLFKRRILVLGAGKRAAQFLKLRRMADQRGFKLVRYMAMPGDQPAEAELPQKRVLPLPDDLFAFARRHHIDEIVIALDDRRGKLPIRALLECRLDGIDCTDVMNFLERETGKINLDLVRPSWFIFETGFRRQLARRVAQRVFDVLASLTILVLTSPIMLVVAIAIMVEDGAPVFYRQRRVGKNNQPFEVLKFRSMRTDAEAAGEAVWAKENDDRVTRVGRVIRKLRIDELPQLINVLAGTMSIVGPRPERPEFVEKLREDLPFYMERHRVKPGITGWAQLCYPYGSSDKDALEKLQYDLYYVKNRSLLFDIMILLQTVEVVLWQKGAR